MDLFSLYRVFIEKSDIKVSAEILEPLSPNLNEKVISEIEKRVFIEQNQIPDNIIAKKPIPNETEKQSPSPEPEQTEQQLEQDQDGTEPTATTSAEVIETI